jgi:hypothetical protein
MFSTTLRDRHRYWCRSTGSVIVTNSTAGRIAPSDSFTLDVFGLFASNRPFCQASTRPTGPTAAGIVQVTQPTAGSYCVVDFGETEAIDTTGLAPTATTSGELEGVTTVADSADNYPQQDSVIYLEDQTQAAGVIQDLESGPDLWSFGEVEGTSGCAVDIGGGFFVQDVYLVNAAVPGGSSGPLTCQSRP